MNCQYQSSSLEREAYCILGIEVSEIRKTRPAAIDLFSGAGGLSLGFCKAGFEIVQAVENEPNASTTYRLNNPNTDLIEEDIQRLDPAICLRRVGLRSGELTALIAGPPCQGFSESNRRTRTTTNPKNHLYKDFLRFLKVMRPMWMVFENVSGLRTLSHGLILQLITEGCNDIGYKTESMELDSAHYGVPQHRRRLFVIGNRAGLPVLFPTPTHGDGREPFVTVQEAISDLPVLENGASIDYLPYRNGEQNLSTYQRAMRVVPPRTNCVQGNLVSRNGKKIIRRYLHIAPGQNWEAIPRRLLDNYEDPSRCHTGIYRRLEWDKPAGVIGNFRKNMLVHPSEHRGLSVREAARLQSFPDDYVFLGSIGFQQQQVADAVPPLLAEAVASSIVKHSMVAPNIACARD